MSNFDIRSARESDASHIAKVQVETWQYAYKGQLPQENLDSLSIEQRTKRWQEILSTQKNSRITFVAEIDNHVVGFCSAGPCGDKDMDEKTGQIWALYVDQHAMGKGAGSALMEKSLDYLLKQGFTQAILWVLVTNTKARKWYESRGWICEGKTKEEIINDTPTNDIRYLRKF